MAYADGAYVNSSKRIGWSPRAAQRGFTLIELLVVITIIVLLLSLVVLVSSQVLGSQKRVYTRSIMRNTTMALDSFATVDPLRGFYNRETRRRYATFGPYPPYRLESSPVAQAMVPPPYTGNNLPPSAPLSARLARDISGGTVGNVMSWARLNEGNRNDDNRALYAYLRVFDEAGLAQVPRDALQRLPDGPTAEFVSTSPSPTGLEPTNPESPWVDVLGIYDAWEIPLDYLVYVKLEPNDPTRAFATGLPFKITDRRAVLRSRGIDKELFEAGRLDPTAEIYSEPLPSPTALVDPDSGGIHSLSNAQQAGWVRVRAAGDDYRYVPINSP